jgi:hypothetical protein
LDKSFFLNNLYITGATGQTGGVRNSANTSNNIYCNNVYARNNVYVNGNQLATSSDYRIKENLKPFDNHFNVDYLQPITYINTLTEKQDIGFLAHELQEYYPELVNGVKDGSELQSINYLGLIPILIHEIKNMKNEMKNTDKELKMIVEQLEKIKNN